MAVFKEINIRNSIYKSQILFWKEPKFVIWFVSWRLFFYFYNFFSGPVYLLSRIFGITICYCRRIVKLGQLDIACQVNHILRLFYLTTPLTLRVLLIQVWTTLRVLLIHTFFNTITSIKLKTSIQDPNECLQIMLLLYRLTNKAIKK